MVSFNIALGLAIIALAAFPATNGMVIGQNGTVSETTSNITTTEGSQVSTTVTETTLITESTTFTDTASPTGTPFITETATPTGTPFITETDPPTRTTFIPDTDPPTRTTTVAVTSLPARTTTITEASLVTAADATFCKAWGSTYTPDIATDCRSYIQSAPGIADSKRDCPADLKFDVSSCECNHPDAVACSP
ncbi:endoglucanase-like [Watersipora subatra]|uniref:endoglucanase-like n=1 Tax=Watersipora subatra TaxID=2589382 RepID=UPI00355AF48A